MPARRPHSSDRHTAILRTLRRSGNCAVGDLADELRVSRETIRRDIRTLEQEGLLRSVHGGAVLPDFYQGVHEPAFRLRMNSQAEEKQTIAWYVAQQISPGESVVLDSGSTNIYVAYALESVSDLLVITNNVEIARILGSQTGKQVYCCGGHFRADDGAVFGRSAVEFLGQFHVRKAILSIGAISLEDGFLDFSMEEAEFARAALQRADRVIVGADHTKFGRQAPIRVGDFDEVNVVVTERVPPTLFTDELDRFENCQLIVADADEPHSP